LIFFSDSSSRAKEFLDYKLCIRVLYVYCIPSIPTYSHTRFFVAFLFYFFCISYLHEIRPPPNNRFRSDFFYSIFLFLSIIYFYVSGSGRLLPAHKRSNAVHASLRNIIQRQEQKSNRVKQNRFRMCVLTLSNLGVLNCYFDFETSRKIVRKHSFMLLVICILYCYICIYTTDHRDETEITPHDSAAGVYRIPGMMCNIISSRLLVKVFCTIILVVSILVLLFITYIIRLNQTKIS